MNLIAEQLLQKAEIKPTANRLLVADALMNSDRPMSLIELETALETLERSSISRVLSIMLKKDIIHAFEDGRGVTKYEICHGISHFSIEDMHAHFYCEKCNRVFCFEDISARGINLPPKFTVRSVNYMLKGICPDCASDN